MKLPKIPRIAWIAVAAAAVGYVVYRLVIQPEQPGGGGHTKPKVYPPPNTTPGIVWQWNRTEGWFDIVDSERSKVFARCGRINAPRHSFAIESNEYVHNLDGKFERRWPRSSTEIPFFL